MAKKPLFGKKLISLLVLFFGAFIISTLIYFQKSPDGKLHLIFCDVGQGDAILVRTPTGAQILIDGGPDNSVLSCLGKAMPFFDRTLELVVLTHPQADHFTGLVSVLENYQVEKVLRTQAVNSTEEFKEFLEAELTEKAAKFEAKSNLTINLDEKLSGKIIWPPKSILGPTSDLNDLSIVLRLNYGNFCAMFTGDATNDVWYELAAQGSLSSCFLLKVAHHGSKNATNPEFLEIVKPKIALVSAGKNNRYGHPHGEVLEELTKRQIRVLATAEIGTIEIITDGKSVQIK